MTLTTDDAAGRPLTGRTVLFWLLGFFGVMLVANAAFVYFAVVSFPGIAVDSAYQAGRAYDAEVARAEGQARRGWALDLEMSLSGAQNVLTVDARDREGRVLTGLDLTATLSNLKGPDLDRTLGFRETESGRYVADAGVLDRGRWTMILDAARAGERQYRSINRLFVE